MDKYLSAALSTSDEDQLIELVNQIKKKAVEEERAAILLRVKNRASAGALLVKDFQEIVNDRGPVVKTTTNVWQKGEWSREVVQGYLVIQHPLGDSYEFPLSVLAGHFVQKAPPSDALIEAVDAWIARGVSEKLRTAIAALAAQAAKQGEQENG